MDNKYSINVAWSDLDDCFVATIPKFPYLSAFGSTHEEAAAEAQIAIDMALEILEEDVIAAPKPDKLNQYSGQVRLRMPKDLHRELSRAAEVNEVSLNTYMTSMLQKEHTKERIYSRIAGELSMIIDQHEKQFEILERKLGEPAGDLVKQAATFCTGDIKQKVFHLNP